MKGSLSFELLLLIIVGFLVVLASIGTFLKQSSIIISHKPSEHLKNIKVLLFLREGVKHPLTIEYLKMSFDPYPATVEDYDFYDLLDYQMYFIERDLSPYTEINLARVLKSTRRLAVFWSTVLHNKEYREEVQKANILAQIQLPPGTISFVPTINCGMLCGSTESINITIGEPLNFTVLNCTIPLVKIKVDSTEYPYVCLGRNTLTYAVLPEDALRYSLPYTFTIITNFLEYYVIKEK